MVRLWLAFGAAFAVALPVGAAKLSLPPVPHYELDAPRLPQSAPPPRYTEHYRQSGAEDRSGDQKGEPRKSFWERTTDDPNTFFAFWVAVFTAVLALSTVGLWIVSICASRRQSRDMRDSIKIAERSLTELERPFVYADVTEPGISIVPASHKLGNQLNRGILNLTFFNVGRTPANLTRVEFKINPAPKGGIAEPIDPTIVGGRELPVGILCFGEHVYTETENLRLEFLNEEDDIVLGNVSLWLIGFIRYSDTLGNHYIAGFCKAFDRSGQRWVPRGDRAVQF